MQGNLLPISRVWRDIDAREINHSYLDVSLIESFGYFRTEKLSKHCCLFLLGRPGAGKSAEVRRIEEGAISSFSDECVVRFECKEFGADIWREITDSPEWSSAMAGPKPIRLVLDGLDEGFLREANYFNRLSRVLRNLRGHHPELRLILTCRPAEWRSEFAQEIHSLWGGIGKVPVFSIEPLTHVQIVELARSRKLPPDKVQKFSEWLRLNRFEEFAEWPRSLEWLVDEFIGGRRDRLTYSDLCRRRVERGFGEDVRFTDAGQAQNVTAWSDAVMLVAATLVFCGRKGITLQGSELECLSLDEMFSSRSLLAFPGGSKLSRETIREAVQKASHLMEAHGSFHRFQNQSDLEYLASAKLGSLDIEQVSELFGAPEPGGKWRVFPQLATTAANLAVQSPEFFEYLLQHDPRALLRVDFAKFSDDRKSAAVDAIFKAIATARATAHDQHAHYTTLRHPGLSAQLAPWLFDKRMSLVVRHLAFDIARETCEAEFWEEFWRVASDGSDEFLDGRLPTVIRLRGHSWPEDRLRTLAASQNDSIAGTAMDALLDRGWRPFKLAPFLRAKNSNTFGAFEGLLHRMAKMVNTDDVAPLLAICEQESWGEESYEAGGKFTASLFATGVANLDRMDVRKAVTGFLIRQSEELDWFHRIGMEELKKLGIDEPERRRKLLLAIAEDWPSEAREQLPILVFPISPEDHEWLLGETARATGNAARVLAFIASRLAWRLDENLRGALERAYDASPQLRAELPPTDESGIFETLRRIQRESDEKTRLRFSERKSNRKPYSHENHLRNALARARADEASAWTDICVALSEAGPDGYCSEFFKCNGILSLPGWARGTELQRAELARFARNFLLEIVVPEHPPDQTPYHCFSIVYALDIHCAALVDDAALRAAIQPFWAKAVFRCCGENGDVYPTLISALTKAAPEMMRSAWHDEFQKHWNRNGTIYPHLRSDAWNTVVESALIHVLSGTPLQPESYISGIIYLAQRNRTAATHIAEQRLTEYASQQESVARRASVAACIFILPELWAKAWPSFTEKTGDARQLLLEYAEWLDWPEREPAFKAMTNELLASLYGLLMREFPLTEAPRHEGAHFYTTLDHVYHLHNRVQSILESRGQVLALQEIFRTAEVLRDAWWTGPSIERARINAHSARRSPPEPAEFIRFLATEGGTFISDNDSLQRAVIASLRRYEKSLYPDAIMALWEKGVPRSEEVFQVEIARHLKQDFRKDGVVINMEAKVVSRESTDIRVEAGEFSVTVEVKLGHSKDKHRPLKKAMQSQLRDGYLKKLNETHGVYVVGWFFCGVFNAAGLRDMKTLTAARKFFASQAAKVSTPPFQIASIVLDCRWRKSAGL